MSGDGAGGGEQPVPPAGHPPRVYLMSVCLAAAAAVQLLSRAFQEMGQEEENSQYRQLAIHLVSVSCLSVWRRWRCSCCRESSRRWGRRRRTASTASWPSTSCLSHVCLSVCLVAAVQLLSRAFQEMGQEEENSQYRQLAIHLVSVSCLSGGGGGAAVVASLPGDGAGGGEQPVPPTGHPPRVCLMSVCLSGGGGGAAVVASLPGDGAGGGGQPVPPAGHPPRVYLMSVCLAAAAAVQLLSRAFQEMGQEEENSQYRQLAIHLVSVSCLSVCLSGGGGAAVVASLPGDGAGGGEQPVPPAGHPPRVCLMSVWRRWRCSCCREPSRRWGRRRRTASTANWPSTSCLSHVCLSVWRRRRCSCCREPSRRWGRRRRTASTASWPSTSCLSHVCLSGGGGGGAAVVASLPGDGAGGGEQPVLPAGHPPRVYLMSVCLAAAAAVQLLSRAFQEMGQEEENSQYRQLAIYLASEFFVTHQNRDVRLLVACCIADIFRIFAPDAPYTDHDQLKVNPLPDPPLRRALPAEGRTPSLPPLVAHFTSSPFLHFLPFRISRPH